MSDKYILVDRKPVPATLMEWAKWFESGDKARRVALTEFDRGNVSTVFLGIDHRFGGDGEPIACARPG